MTFEFWRLYFKPPKFLGTISCIRSCSLRMLFCRMVFWKRKIFVCQTYLIILFNSHGYLSCVWVRVGFVFLDSMIDRFSTLSVLSEHLGQVFDSWTLDVGTSKSRSQKSASNPSHLNVSYISNSMRVIYPIGLYQTLSNGMSYQLCTHIRYTTDNSCESDQIPKIHNTYLLSIQSDSS